MCTKKNLLMSNGAEPRVLYSGGTYYILLIPCFVFFKVGGRCLYYASRYILSILRIWLNTLSIPVMISIISEPKSMSDSSESVSKWISLGWSLTFECLCICHTILPRLKLQTFAVLQALVTKLLYMAVVRSPRIYHFLAEPKMIRRNAKVSSFTKHSVTLLYMAVLRSPRIYHFLPEPKTIHRTA